MKFYFSFNQYAIFSVLFSLLVISCNTEEDKGWPPIARFSVTPQYVTINTETQVVLDARASCDQLDYPELCDKSEDGNGTPSTCPGGITYSWDIPNAELEVSDKNNALLRIKIKINRPVPITLTVTDCDGNSVSKTQWLGVSEPE